MQGGRGSRRAAFRAHRKKPARGSLTLPIPEYERIRADPRQFVVLPLHYTPEIEELVEETETYWIVRKVGEAGAYVEHLDPRSR